MQNSICLISKWAAFLIRAGAILGDVPLGCLNYVKGTGPQRGFRLLEWIGVWREIQQLETLNSLA